MSYDKTEALTAEQRSEKTLYEYLSDPSRTESEKRYTINVNIQSTQASIWGYEFLSSDDLSQHAYLFPFSEEAAYAAAKNENITWRNYTHIINGMTNSNYEERRDIEEIYITHMNDVSAHLLLENIAKDDDIFFNNSVAICERARKLYGFDKDIPDAWVAHFLTGKTSQDDAK